MFQKISIHLASQRVFSTCYPEKDSEGITPQTRVLFFCMIAAGMERIFSQKDCHELIFRMGVMFRQLDVIDNFFRDGYFFDFAMGENYFRLTPDDLMAHTGLYITDYPDEAMPREEWYKKMPGCLEHALIMASLAGAVNPLSEKIMKPEDVGIKPSQNLADHAAFFADTVMRDIPEKMFLRFCTEQRELLEKIDKYLAFAKSPLPLEYNWNHIPAKNQQAILKHLLEESSYREGMTMEEAIKTGADYIPDLVYLAWLKVNGFVTDLFRCEVDPRASINPERYLGLGVNNGISLEKAYQAFDLEKIEKYLVTPPHEKSY
jgi:hypothetical protein